TPLGSMLPWQSAQAGSARCRTIASRSDSSSPDFAPSVLSDGTLGGGGGGGEASRFSRTYFPRSTGDVRVEYEVSSRMPPCPSSPPRGLFGGKVTRWNSAPRILGMP